MGTSTGRSAKASAISHRAQSQNGVLLALRTLEAFDRRKRVTCVTLVERAPLVRHVSGVKLHVDRYQWRCRYDLASGRLPMGVGRRGIIHTIHQTRHGGASI